MTCTNCPSVGANAQIMLEPGSSAYTWDSSSLLFEMLGETMSMEQRWITPPIITGLPYDLSDRSRSAGSIIRGRIRMVASPGIFDIWLPYLVGTLDTGVHTPSNCPNNFGLLIDKDYSTFEYKDCIVSDWKLSGAAPNWPSSNAEPDPMILDVGVLGISSVKGTTWPASPPTFPTGDAYIPYIFQDSGSGAAITISGSTRSCYEALIWWNNNPFVDWVNSTTPTAVCPQGRKTGMTFRAPWNSANEALYDNGIDGAAASFTLTLENMSTLFTFTNFKIPSRDPQARNKSKVYFELMGKILGTTTTKDFLVTNDYTN